MNLFVIENFLFVIFLSYFLVNFFCFFLCSKSIRCVFGWLVLRFVVEENDLHHAYVVVNGNKLILW